MSCTDAGDSTGSESKHCADCRACEKTSQLAWRFRIYFIDLDVFGGVWGIVDIFGILVEFETHVVQFGMFGTTLLIRGELDWALSN